MQKRHAIIESEIHSPNFSFLANLDLPLMHQAALAAQKTDKEVQQTLAFSKTASNKVDLTEADTRKLIDQQLRAAGWEADTAEIRESGTLLGFTVFQWGFT